jgi:hypothetical protein
MPYLPLSIAVTAAMALATGWGIGRSTPGWEADQASDTYNYGGVKGSGCGYPIFYNDSGRGCLPSLGAVLTLLAWVATHATWLILGCLAAGYIAAAATDRGLLRRRTPRKEDTEEGLQAELAEDTGASDPIYNDEA